MVTKSIDDPKAFYDTLLKWIDINIILNGQGRCKLIKDMTHLEYIEYESMVTEYVRVEEK